MKAVFDPRQKAHDPASFIRSGAVAPNPEAPERVERLLAGLGAAGAELIGPADYGLAPIAAIHAPDYIEFLQTIHGRWIAMEGASEQVIPNMHPARIPGTRPSGPVGLAGWHQADTACPIDAHTWESAYWSAQTALTAAELVREGERWAYALCRPPGHHAYADMAGGFSFLNSAAIAAEALLRAGRRPAIVDVDVHHGNGTQGIFYARRDVLTVSLHRDPVDYYPFFWGHAHERGEGDGAGFNLNLPQPEGTSDDAYLAALEGAAFRRIEAFAPDVLIVALGLDAFEGDPLKGLSVTTPGFSRIGAAIAGLGLPTVAVQEGGYLCPELGENLTAFLEGFGAAT
ncbi:MAG: histone deacetylase family protein [Pseudomonadota bacterium]